MRYLLVADLHLTEHSPTNCTESYADDLFALLEQTVVLAREREASAVIWAGDVYHNKAPARTSHRLVQRIIRLVRSYSCPVWIVPGNHDLAHDRLASVNETQPLGVLYATGAAHCLDGWMGGQDPVFGVPWQQHWSAEGIGECLRPYREQVYAAGLGSQRPLIVTHAPIYPPSCEPRYEGAELTPADWWADAAQGGPGGHSVFYGHIHERHGTWTRRSVEFCNNGALSRGSLGEDNLTRQVGVTLWSPDAGFEFIPLDARPASQVFRLVEHGAKVTAQMSLDRFLGGLSETVLPRLDPATVLEQFRAQPGVGPEDLSLAAELLEWSEHEGAKR